MKTNPVTIAQLQPGFVYSYQVSRKTLSSGTPQIGS